MVTLVIVVQIRRTSDQAEVDVAFDSNGNVSNSSSGGTVTEETSSGSTQVHLLELLCLAMVT